MMLWWRGDWWLGLGFWNSLLKDIKIWSGSTSRRRVVWETDYLELSSWFTKTFEVLLFFVIFNHILIIPFILVKPFAVIAITIWFYMTTTMAFVNWPHLITWFKSDKNNTTTIKVVNGRAHSHELKWCLKIIVRYFGASI